MIRRSHNEMVRVDKMKDFDTTRLLCVMWVGLGNKHFG